VELAGPLVYVKVDAVYQQEILLRTTGENAHKVGTNKRLPTIPTAKKARVKIEEGATISSDSEEAEKLRRRMFCSMV